jgi:hypothetical protein
MTRSLGDLKRQVEEFAQEMDELFTEALPNLPDPVVDVLAHELRYELSAGAEGKGLPLFVAGKEVATLKASLRCRLDSVEKYLAVEQSSFVLLAKLDRMPVIRFDFVRDMNMAPTAHVQIHAHRGALSHLLSQADHPTPHDISALHIPVGGSRFRPCLEDVIQFLIQECRFDSKPGWRIQVEKGRERWRRRQVAAVTRDVPEEAARVLEELGYSLTRPTEHKLASVKALRNW